MGKKGLALMILSFALAYTFAFILLIIKPVYNIPESSLYYPIIYILGGLFLVFLIGYVLWKKRK